MDPGDLNPLSTGDRPVWSSGPSEGVGSPGELGGVGTTYDYMVSLIVSCITAPVKLTSL